LSHGDGHAMNLVIVRSPVSKASTDCITFYRFFCFIIFTLCNGDALTYRNSLKHSCIVETSMKRLSIIHACSSDKPLVYNLR
jgi:hypothetical protein